MRRHSRSRGVPEAGGRTTCVGYGSRVDLFQPFVERDLALVDGATALFALSFGDGEELAGGLVAGEKDAAFLEELAQGGVPVPGCIFVAFLVLWGRTGSVLGVQVSSGEHMGGREGGGCFDAVKQEDLILRRDKDDTCDVLVVVTWAISREPYCRQARRTWSSGWE